MTGFRSALTEGQKLRAIWAPYNEEGQAGACVGFGECVEIIVGQCSGPMGMYDVAIIRYEPASGKEDEIMPIHMGEVTLIAKPEAGAEG